MPDTRDNAGIMQSTAAKTIRAVSPNGAGIAPSLQESVHSSIWKYLIYILPHREDIIMADGRQIKGGIIIHPIIATALVGVVITIGLAMYNNFSKELSWQHDQLVRITTQKEDAEKAASREAEELSKRLQNIEATQIALGRDIVRAQEMQKAKNPRN